MKKLKLAFVGGGLNSVVGMTHKIASQMDGRFEVVAGCFCTNQKKNEQTGKQWHVNRVYRTWQTLLESEKDKTDAVVVLTPTPYHTEIVLGAIKSGYPVIREKAVTASISDLLKIKEALKKHNGYLTVTYNYKGN